MGMKKHPTGYRFDLHLKKEVPKYIFSSLILISDNFKAHVVEALHPKYYEITITTIASSCSVGYTALKSNRCSQSDGIIAGP
jgi:hypothetical protein